jgi:type IV pilus assembly protein PilP
MMKRMHVKASHVLASLLLVVAAVATSLAQPIGSNPAATHATDTSTAAVDSSAGNDVQKTLEEILEEPTTTDTYRYDPQGRRDPFRSLIGPTPRLEPGQRPPGTRGFLIDEMKLQGVFQTRQGLTAMINGPDNKGYLLKAGDKVLDGEVIRITATGIVFRQELNDPTRIERYREVVKDLVPSARK